MGMFDWLKSKQKLENDVLYLVRHIPQDFPKSPCPIVVEDTAKSISEPAYTLAKMLGRDEWEYVFSSGHVHGVDWYDKHLVNVFKENIEIRIRHEVFYFDGPLSWCTNDEKELLRPLITDCKDRCIDLLRQDKRERFKKTLGVI